MAGFHGQNMRQNARFKLRRELHAVQRKRKSQTPFNRHNWLVCDMC